MPGVVARADDDGAGAVAEQERDASGRSGSTTSRELLGADDERVVGGAGADEGVGLGDRRR